ncbi:MAG: spore cortex biosynthesis protein YabQ [Clostridia bacterium]|nr:spore cortex biosynthesis protein YabQ [Clostridia bacterium]
MSIFFDLFKIISAILALDKKVIFVQDILYFLIAGIFTFVFLLAFNNGKIHFYIFLGELLGWTMWHVTLGNAITNFLIKCLTMALKPKKLNDPIN